MGGGIKRLDEAGLLHPVDQAGQIVQLNRGDGPGGEHFGGIARAAGHGDQANGAEGDKQPAHGDQSAWRGEELYLNDTRPGLAGLQGIWLERGFLEWG